MDLMRKNLNTKIDNNFISDGNMQKVPSKENMQVKESMIPLMLYNKLENSECLSSKK